jgi:hypothetical protein
VIAVKIGYMPPSEFIQPIVIHPTKQAVVRGNLINKGSLIANAWWIIGIPMGIDDLANKKLPNCFRNSCAMKGLEPSPTEATVNQLSKLQMHGASNMLRTVNALL